MKATSFNYKSYHFKPVGNIIGGWENKMKYITPAYTLEPADYTHADFYKVARKHHASCDIYEVAGKYYIPCEKALMGLCGDWIKDLKRIEEYSRWYN